MIVNLKLTDMMIMTDLLMFLSVHNRVTDGRTTLVVKLTNFIRENIVGLLESDNNCT